MRRKRRVPTALLSAVLAGLAGTAGCLVFVVQGPDSAGLPDSGIQQINLPDGGLGYVLPDGGITDSLVEPVCTASPTSGPPGTKVYFDGNGSQGSPGAEVDQWLWTFGDGSSDSVGGDATPSHVYTDAGSYTATLTASDNSGASAATTCPTVTITP